MDPRFVAHLEVADIGVPHDRIVGPPHGEAEQPLRDLEEPGLDFLEGEPGPKHLFVHLEALPAQILHQPSHVPRAQGVQAATARMRFEFGRVAPCGRDGFRR